MATSGCKRNGRLAEASKTTVRSAKTGGWSTKSAVTGQFSQLKESRASFKGVRKER
jgi:hypothetical protein